MMAKKFKKMLALTLAITMTTGAAMPVYAAPSESTDETSLQIEILSDGGESIAGVINVPLTDVDDPATEEIENQSTAVFGDPAGTTTIFGDIPTGSDDTEYDYTIATTVKQGEVTVTTTDINITQQETPDDTQLKNVVSETSPDDTNDLYHLGAIAPEQYLPGYTEDPGNPADAPEIDYADGYEYTFVGSSNTSMFRPAPVFSQPLTDEEKVRTYGDDAYISTSHVAYYVGCLTEEARNNLAKGEGGDYIRDEEGFILDKQGNRVLKEELVATDPDGNTVYLHRFDALADTLAVEGWYQDGEWIKELNGTDQYITVWSGPQQFVLVDRDGNVVNAYCVDLPIHTQEGYGYNVKNLEDANHYTEAEAAMIRSIALNGYWGTVGNMTDADGNELLDDNNNPIPKLGSLEALKQSLLATGEFTQEELDASLNDGVALSATQMAIWTYSNKLTGTEFVNAYYGEGQNGDIPLEKEDEVKLMFRIYNYLIGLNPIETLKDSSNTIINAENYISSMSVNVIEKANDHANNNDDDDSNDAYVTNLSFALVVEPSTENGDCFEVKVITADGQTYTALIGNAPEGSNVLDRDANGNYVFRGITLTEGDQTFSISLTGIQNLKQGVYLYSSEVRDEVSSQTLVGIAEGPRAVNVSMDITFNLNVDYEVTATERVWHEEEPVVPYNRPRDPGTITEIPEGEVPLADLTVILDEEIPLADVPLTGDHSAVWFALSLLSAVMLLGAAVIDRRRKAYEI